ncbi:MAG: sugar transferase [Gemmatimonadota bacterium]|jgi:lipopolysaccharide/colanic/teichoic acid biosynthesis glycosyltransferase
MASAAPLNRGDVATRPSRVAVRPEVARSRTKRVLDVVGGVLLGILAIPLGLLIALAIRLDSRGAAVFRQERVGLDGERFTIFKFRSMYSDCEEDAHRNYVTGLVNGEREASNGGVYKLVGDARVTRVGAWLRRTSLDELPQLVNVLRGEMSLVGPRPPLPYEVDQYDAEQLGRLGARPGVTGLWQVSGRNQLSYRDMVQLDLEYIQEWSLLLDLKILLRTIPVVLRNSGKAH